MKQIVLGGTPKRKGGRPAPKRRRRRTGRQALNYLLLLIVAAAIMLALSMTVLFQVKTVVTDGVTHYPPQALIGTCGVKEGDNLLRISERAVRKKLVDGFPYVENVTLKRVFPDKLVLQVQEATVLGACETADGYVIVGDTGRILEIGADAVPEGVMEVYGMYMYAPKVGNILGQFNKEQTAQIKKEREAAQKAAEKAAQKNGDDAALAVPVPEKSEEDREGEDFEKLKYLVEAVRETGFDSISLVDLSDSLNMAVVYEGRVLIELGSVADMSYKLQFVSRVLTRDLPDDFQGVVDASYCTTSKEVVTSSRDISQELEKRRLRAAAQAQKQAAQEQSGDKKPNNALYPDLDVIPQKESSSKDAEDDVSSSGTAESGDSSDTSSGTSSQDESGDDSSSEEMIGPYKAEDLVVRPAPGAPSSESQDTRAVSAADGASSSGENLR